MDKKTAYLATQIHSGSIESVNHPEIPIKIEKPEGCIGICFVFETKEDAYNFFDENIKFVEVEVSKDE